MQKSDSCFMALQMGNEGPMNPLRGSRELNCPNVEDYTLRGEDRAKRLECAD
jgi:hypothetical protein